MSYRAWGDSRGVIALRPIWQHLIRERNTRDGVSPIERVDLLDRLKIFGDIHRPSRFELSGRITPIIDLTAPGEQVPTMFSSLFVAGVAAVNTAITLSLGAFATVIARLVWFDVIVSGGSAAAVDMWTAAHPYLAGAPVASGAGLTDTRRGLVATPQPQAQALLSGSAAANAAPPSGALEVIAPTAVTQDQQFANIADFYNKWIVQPNVDLIWRCNVVNIGLRVNVLWSEEPAYKATRALG